MQPPFFGTKIIEEISLSDLEGLLDRESLFAGRWQFRKDMTSEAWEEFKKGKVVPVYEKIMAMCRSRAVMRPRIVYGYFSCRNSAKSLFVEGEGRFFRFDFPRERRVPHRCLADFFPDGFVAMQVATAGDGVNKEAARLFSENKYSESFYIKGLASEIAEAAACFGNNLICKELGIPEERGVRFSPGYPSFPDLLDQRKIVALLKPQRIGVSLTKTCMFVPEHSTSAIISVDPKAVHFNPDIS